jgi:SnoaL-like domain
VRSPEVDDIIEIEQLLARYAMGMTKEDIEAVVAVFTPEGTYSAFGSIYGLDDFPALVRAAPKGIFLTGAPVIEIDGETGRGEQPLCFVDQTNHEMRIGFYTDTYRRTDAGWRLATRSMTFLRRNGSRDAGRTHDPLRPEPTRPGSSSSETTE